MRFELEPGKYVVAVSGGVDSVVLLHLLMQKQNAERRKKNDEGESAFDVLHSPFSFTVAHFDHGIREDSAEDRRHVQALAKEYGLPFAYQRAELGPGVSEAVARDARYAFLHQVRQSSGAGAIITAHHQDDVLETMILNLLRGTGRRGLSSLKSTDVVKRPLLHIPKRELLRYAKREGLQWREDSTNTDDKYLRNYVRANILPRFAERDREALLGISQQMGRVNAELGTELNKYLAANSPLDSRVHGNDGELDRHSFVMLPHVVAREVMAEWLLANTGAELSRKLLERLVVAAKTGRSGSKVDVGGGHWLRLSAEWLTLEPK